MPRLSVVIITLNEAINIKRCIASCLKVSDDIILIDAFSTDKTVEIAQSLGARTYQMQWEGYGYNKNKGNELAKYDWVLSIDADEELDEELVDALLTTPLTPNTVYCINRLTQFGDQWVFNSGWHPLHLPRLFEKNKVLWNNNAVHESLIIPKRFNKKRLQGLCLHYSFDSKHDFENRLEKYSELRAESWIKQSKSPNLIKKWIGPLGRFLTVYFFKKGILDGRLGFYIAKQEANMVANALKIYHQKLKQ